MTNIYTIGDIHGCRDQLERLIELCERNAVAEGSKFIFLGDYIDRGSDSRGVIEFLMALQKWSPDEMIFLRGNHEQLLLDALEGEDAEISWLSNGGEATFRSYRSSRAMELPNSHLDWIRSLPFFHDDGRRSFLSMLACTPIDHLMSSAPATCYGFENRFYQVAKISEGSLSMVTRQLKMVRPTNGLIA